MPGAIDAIAEIIREEEANDKTFLQEHLVFFEVQIDEGPAAGNYLFPLVVPPKRSSVEEPALVALDLTVTGGVHAQENGVPIKPLVLSGNYGWAPKEHKIPAGWNRVMSDSQPDGGRIRSFWSPAALSGKRHLEYLHEVFRAYWARKTDPEKSRGTRMIYHCPTEDEHWLVIPRSMRVERTEANPVGSADWQIALSEVAPAEAVRADFSPDKPLWERIKDLRARIRAAIDLGSAFVADVRSVIGEIREFVDGIDTIVGSMLGIIDELGSVADAGASLSGSIIRRARDLSDTLENLAERFEIEPYRHIRAAFMDAADGMAMVAMYPEQPETPVPGAGATGLRTTETQPAAGPPGSGNLPGDAARALARRDDVGSGRVFPSVIEHEVSRTDTLESIATRFLGDPGEWGLIAELNGLREPYLSEDAIPGTAQPGARLLVPSRRRTPNQNATLAAFRTETTAQLEERVLGRDIALVRLETGLYGFALSDSGDDVRVIGGRGCFKQGLEIRTRTEIGTDGLYPGLGIRRVVGVRFKSVTDAMATLRLVESVRADPRVAATRVVRSERPPGQADALLVQLEVVPKGLAVPLTFTAGALPGAQAA